MTRALTIYLRAAGIVALAPLLTACPPAGAPTLAFPTSFTTLTAKTTATFTYSVTLGTAPGASRKTDFEIFPNTAGVFTNFGPNILVNKPTYSVLTDSAGLVTGLWVRCDTAGHAVQVRATDTASGEQAKFEFNCV